MKRILFYINTLEHGGAERVITNLANQFSAAGYAVDLATSFPCDFEYETSENVNRINLFNSYINGGLKRNLKLFAALRKVIKINKPNVVVSFMREPNYRAIPACIGTKAKCFVSVRNDPNKEYRGKANKLLAKMLFRFADGVIFQTEDAKAWFPKSIQKKSTIILNQVDERFFKTKFDGERSNIVTVGRLQPQKNHKLLINAFDKIKDKTNQNLIIYGEGELRQQLETLINELNLKDRVFLPGAISDVPNTIKSAELFVLPSDYEGMPNALIEAMSLGLICLSTDCPCGGPKALIESGVNGYLTPVKDCDLMAEAMLNALNRGKEQKEQLICNVLKTAENFKSDIIFKKWEEYLIH